jgi:hypothetical protein
MHPSGRLQMFLYGGYYCLIRSIQVPAADVYVSYYHFRSGGSIPSNCLTIYPMHVHWRLHNFDKLPLDMATFPKLDLSVYHNWECPDGLYILLQLFCAFATAV